MQKILRPHSEDESKGPDLSNAALFIKYDPQTQQVQLFHDSEQAKTWEFIIGLLTQARLVAEFNLKMAQGQAVAMQQQAMHNQMQAAQQQLAMVGKLNGR